MRKLELNYETTINEITPPLYDMESMFWVVVAPDLYEKYGVVGERAARTWLRRHANWRGRQIRKGSQALGVPVNVENLFVYTDNPVNNAFIPMWKKDFGWTPHNLKLKVSPGECVMCDRMLQHDIGLMGDVFCDELHQSFTTTYHPDAVVSVCRTMTKGDDHCMFQWVLPGDARVPETLPPYPGENVAEDWLYDTEHNIIKGGIKRMMRWYAAAIYYLREVLEEFLPDVAEKEYVRLLHAYEDARAECIMERNGDKIGGKSAREALDYFDMPYILTWDMEVRDIAGGIELDVSYCPLEETWNWIGDKKKMSVYCDSCYQRMYSKFNPGLKTEVCTCKTRGDAKCLVRIHE